MGKKRRTIIWEYWTNPLGGGKEYTDEAEKPPDDDTINYFDNDPEEVSGLVRPVIPTSMGMVPVQIYGSFHHNFNFWIGHTNFTIDGDDHERGYKGVATRIEEVEGVEILDILTRYRFRVGIGKAFQSSEVKEAIHDALGVHIEGRGEENPEGVKLPSSIKDDVDSIRKSLDKESEFWVVYVVPNGKIDFKILDSKSEYDSVLELYRQTQELAGGVIFKSYGNE